MGGSCAPSAPGAEFGEECRRKRGCHSKVSSRAQGIQMTRYAAENCVAQIALCAVARRTKSHRRPEAIQYLLQYRSRHSADKPRSCLTPALCRLGLQERDIGFPPVLLPNHLAILVAFDESSALDGRGLLLDAAYGNFVVPSRAQEPIIAARSHISLQQFSMGRSSFAGQALTNDRPLPRRDLRCRPRPPRCRWSAASRETHLRFAGWVWMDGQAREQNNILGVCQFLLSAPAPDVARKFAGAAIAQYGGLSGATMNRPALAYCPTSANVRSMLWS